MFGYIIAGLTLLICGIYIHWNKKVSHLKNERIINAIPDMVFILDRSLNVLKIYNPDKTTLLVDPETLLGTNLKEYFPEKELRQFEKGVKSALNSNITLEIEYSLVLNAETQYFEARYLKIDDNTVTCIVRNITERKKAEIAIKQNQEFLNSVLDNIPFPVMLKDTRDHFRYLYWNQECNKQSGFQREDILGKTDIDLYGPERGGKYQSIDRKIVEDGVLYTAQEEFVTPDGVKHDTIVSKNIIKNDMYSWLLVVRRDITDLVSIQNRLRDTNQINQLILDNSNAGFIFIGSDRVVKWENVSLNLPSGISGAYRQGEVCYKGVRGLDHVCPNCIMDEAIQSGKTIRHEFTVQENIITEIVATPVWAENKELQGVVIRVEDITLKKKAEAELRQAKEDAEKSDRLKSAFLANISHEIRTPLNAIVGFSELLCSTQEIEEQKKYMQIIRGNNEQLLQLISDILDISKIESDTFDFIYSRVDIAQLFDEINKIVSFKLLPNPGVEIKMNMCQSHCMIYTEGNRLLQVLVGFLSNAIKFTEQGSITIGYEKRENELYFYVSDTGIGIPGDKQDMIFERFTKLDNFKSGTGLGLAICQAIIKKLNGKIGVNSKPGEGATFWFTLPVEHLSMEE